MQFGKRFDWRVLAAAMPVVAFPLVGCSCGLATGIGSDGVSQRISVVWAGADSSESSAERPPSAVCLFIVVDKPRPELQSTYHLSPLKYPAADARVLGDSFRKLGVPAPNLVELRNEQADRAAIVSSIRAVGKKVRPGDTLFVFFFGHGIGTRGKSRLIAHDEPVPVELLLTELGSTGAGRKVLVVDACRSGSPGSPQFELDAETARGRANGLAVICSARADQEAYESDKLRHGVFSYHLAAVLNDAEAFDQNHDNWLDFEEIVRPVQKYVRDFAAGLSLRQEPHEFTIGWTGPNRLVHVKRQWEIRVGEPRERTTVNVRFDPDALGSGDRLWVVVAPRQMPGRYYPQPGAVIEQGETSPFTGSICLGEQYRGAGEEFTVILVHADAGLHRKFKQPAPEGLADPPLMRLPIVCTLTVRREQ